MKSNCILSFTLSGHGFSGAVCIDGDIKYATSLERLTRVKNDILFPISKSDLETFGWNADPSTYVKNLDFEFDLHKDYSTIDIAQVEKFQLLLNSLLSMANLTFEDIDIVV